MRERLHTLLEPMGVDSFGVCPFPDCAPLLPCRAASRLPSGARSVIVCLFPYHIGEFPRRNVARYAVLPDYHQVAGEILAALAEGLGRAFPGETFVPFVDNSPFREVAAARRAGLGVIGLHGMLISERWGGRVLIGAVAATLPLPPSSPIRGSCRDCGRCLDACPTGALSRDKPFRRERCRSLLTQKKGDLSPWEAEQVEAGGLAWGCDLCVDACPMNTTRLSPIPGFYRDPAPLLTPGNLDALMATRPYGYRGRKVLERNLALLGKR